MSTAIEVRLGPDAVLCLDTPYMDPGREGTTLFFFKNRQFVCWDVVNETMLPGYPRDIADAWPGVMEAYPGSRMRGVLHVPAWGAKVYFFFEGQGEALAWDLAARRVEPVRVPIQELLPSAITREGDFTPVYAQLADRTPVLYAFRGYDYTRWTVSAAGPGPEDAGFPRRIEHDWKDGLVLAPRAGVYVDWPSRSSAHSNRKLYFFMGNLYLRWDVPSNTRNYRLDVLAGWKGWPAFA
ncbi:MAG TPA: hemopexin repeat-containing protein [Usitatibacter sp.]|nr:hemopexin repeat-containing protein [Usitatibacter sp.]